MIRFWRAAAGCMIACGCLGACASPHYPVREGQEPGPPPLTAPTPSYPVRESAPVATATPGPPPAAPPTSEASPDVTYVTPDAAPKVESQPLPPPAPPPQPAAAISAPPADAVAQAPASDVPSSNTPTSAPVAEAPPPAPAPVEHHGPRYAAAGEVVAASGVFENYEVQKGDHIDALARAFHTTRTVLLDANHLKAPYRIHPGQILKTPVAKAYVARSGDTLREVGRRFDVDPGELAQINRISERAPLRSGQRIGLPSSMRDRGPIRLTSEPEYAEETPAPTHWRPPAYSSSAPPAGSLAPLAPEGQGDLHPIQPANPVEGGSASYQTPYPPPRTQAAPPALSDAEVSAAARGRFVWPVRGNIIAGFGSMGFGRRNDGVDIQAAQGSSVQAAAPGEVVYAGDQVPGFGNLVLIKHADGWVTAYAHLDKVDVQMREQVTQGEVLGSVGTTGGVSEPELHFEVRFAPTPADKARPVDPVLVLPAS